MFWTVFFAVYSVGALVSALSFSSAYIRMEDDYPNATLLIILMSLLWFALPIIIPLMKWDLQRRGM